MGVKLRKRGGWYHLDVHNRGRRIRRSLKTADRRKADQIRAELEHSMIGGIWSISLAMDTPFERAHQRYVDEYESTHHAPSTRKHTMLSINRLKGTLAKSYGFNFTLDMVRQADVEAHQRDLLSRESAGGRTLTASSVNRDLREISAFFVWGVGKVHAAFPAPPARLSASSRIS